MAKEKEKTETNNLGLASLVLAILGLVIITYNIITGNVKSAGYGIVSAILGITFAMIQKNKQPTNYSNIALIIATIAFLLGLIHALAGKF